MNVRSGFDKFERFMSFDVESIGLHGEGFAVGWAVFETNAFLVLAKEMPRPTERGLFYCDPDSARGTAADHEWVRANVNIPYRIQDLTQYKYYPETLYFEKFMNPREVRQRFWQQYVRYKTKTSFGVVGDTIWPVEANFFSACVEDESPRRTWDGPFPLLDIATLQQHRGLPVPQRNLDELPAHEPLNDAMHSARLLWELLHQ